MLCFPQTPVPLLADQVLTHLQLASRMELSTLRCPKTTQNLHCYEANNDPDGT